MEKKHSGFFRTKIFRFFFKILCFARSVQVFIFGGEECLCCGKSSGVIPLCESCLEKLLLEMDNSDRCINCGKPLVSEIQLCSSCRTSPVLKSSDASFPLFSYRLWRKNLLFQWKIEDQRTLSPVFASAFYRFYKKLPENQKNNYLAVVPVPPRAGKIRKKGWDQIDELCYYLQKLYEVPVLKVLYRVSKRQQKKLSRNQRLEQSVSAYHLKKEKYIREFMAAPPEKVILVDDVFTTGSTLEACCQALKSAGVKKVFCVTLFIVD